MLLVYPMRALALDATTRRGSVALVEDRRVIVERPGEPSRSQAERLPGELLALVEERHLRLDEIDLFGVASGPGSFTGLRIGIATIQGLAFVSRRPVVGVSTLEAVAHLAAHNLVPGRLVGSWIDAQRGDVFSALYRTTDRDPFTPERLEVVEGAAVGEPAAVLGRWRSFGRVTDAIIAGDGAARYEALLIAAGVNDVRGSLDLAGTIGVLAIVRAERGERVPPAGVRPEYVRRPDAEIDREKRTALSDAGQAPTTPSRGDR